VGGFAGVFRWVLGDVGRGGVDRQEIALRLVSWGRLSIFRQNLDSDDHPLFVLSLRIDRDVYRIAWDADGVVAAEEDRPDEDAFGLAGRGRGDGDVARVLGGKGRVGPG
jgi:hypothetical protein